MDFHPIQQTLLLVGTSVGDITLWEAGSRELLFLKNFNKFRDREACRMEELYEPCFMQLQALPAKNSRVGVKRIIWSPDGSLFGVAYSRDIVQIYSYHGSDDVRLHLELDAHVGGVNDLAFSYHGNQLCVITCGDDKTVKVWDAASGTVEYTFKDHKDPVLTVCPYKGDVPMVLCTDYLLSSSGWNDNRMVLQ
ncbi:hypothetical protein MKW98_019526 [Papaver atlanticum]|uniref:Uncharacterized protein n=1 Tax=Papaver atlanticum TaxID=357466 RepID=A0AAD4S8H3_9MAGN|nr:hypothetical protein MKW98_019526 [Papaver atlanticum]